MRIASVS